MKQVTVYTTTTCAYCEMVKKWLNAKNVAYTVVNLDEQPAEERQKVIEMSGAMTVPVTVVQSPEHEERDVIVGWNPARLAAAMKDVVAA